MTLSRVSVWQCELGIRLWSRPKFNLNGWNLIKHRSKTLVLHKGLDQGIRQSCRPIVSYHWQMLMYFSAVWLIDLTDVACCSFITSAEGGYFFWFGLFVCLFFCLSVGLLTNLWTDFDEIFWRGRAWLKDQVIQYWWQSGSRFGSGSPKSEIRILRIGGGLCSLSIFLVLACFRFTAVINTLFSIWCHHCCICLHF